MVVNAARRHCIEAFSCRGPSATMFGFAAIEQLTLDPQLPHQNTSIAIRLKRARPGNCVHVFIKLTNCAKDISFLNVP
jgi:hypothetical protein